MNARTFSSAAALAAVTPASTDSSEIKFNAAQKMVAEAYERHAKGLVVTTSGGAQAQLMLRLATDVNPEIPVIFIDTGYLFPETYRFIEQLRLQLDLNLHIYKAVRTPAMQEALDGQRWNGTEEEQQAYNLETKVEPMNRAMIELGATAWLTGRRRGQSKVRENLPFVETTRGGIIKYNPIADWGSREVFYYTRNHQLPEHPLKDEGYISIGDVHSTKKGVQKTECGAHDESAAPRTIVVGKAKGLGSGATDYVI